MPITHPSPLRYPGGKAILAPVLADILVENDLHDGTVVEPFAGGAGASLQLLFSEYAGHLVLNDADPRLYAFWRSVLDDTENLIDRVSSVRLSMKLWRQCRDTYRAEVRKGKRLDLAFAVFVLNRCNRSGVIGNGGPIGGVRQTGKWKLGARFNRKELIERLRRIARYRERIKVTCKDARTLLLEPNFDPAKALVFLDPPYYFKGQGLYLNAMYPSDHEELAELLLSKPGFKWLLTYDDVPEIRDLYSSLRPRTFTLGYSAYERRVGKELIVFDPRLTLPEGVFRQRTEPGRLRFGRLAS